MLNEEKATIKVAFKFDPRFGGEVIAHIKALKMLTDGKFQTLNNHGWFQGVVKGQCYSHAGQHSECIWDFITSLPSATPEQYAPLLKEMTEMVGYEIVDVTRKPRRVA